jgi:hypothetical protein
MRTAFITALMMVAARTSETSVWFHETTRRCIPESCHLHTRHRENMIFHNLTITQIQHFQIIILDSFLPTFTKTFGNASH